MSFASFKIVLSITLLSMVGEIAIGQNYIPRIDTLLIDLDFSLFKGDFILRTSNVENATTLKDLNVALVSGDLTIRYELPKEEARNGSYRVSLGLRASQNIIEIDRADLEEDFGTINISGGVKKRIVFKNFIESLLNWEKDIQLELIIEYIPFQYSYPFGLEKDVIYLITGVVSLATVGTGYCLFKDQAQPKYQEYLDLRLEENPRKSLEEAEATYREANRLRHIAMGLIVTGGTVFLFNGVVYLYKEINLKKQRKNAMKEVQRLTFDAKLQHMLGESYSTISVQFNF